jgi:hypothetical protein
MLDDALNRDVLIFRAGIDKPQETLNDQSSVSITLKINERFAVTSASDLSRLLCVIRQVVNV